MTESWERWEPVSGLAKKYYVEKIEELDEAFSISLVDYNNDSNKILLDFNYLVDSYRSVYGTFRHKLIVELDEKYGSDFYGHWTFFKVNNSEYLKWLNQESYTITSSLSLIHFSLIAIDAVVDIIAYDEPKITFL